MFIVIQNESYHNIINTNWQAVDIESGSDYIKSKKNKYALHQHYLLIFETSSPKTTFTFLGVIMYRKLSLWIWCEQDTLLDIGMSRFAMSRYK